MKIKRLQFFWFRPALLVACLFALTASSFAQPSAAPLRHEEIEKATVELRGLPFKTPPVYKTMKRADFVEWARRQFRNQYTATGIYNLGRAFAMLGLLPEDVDLEQEYLTLLEKHALAFYDYKTAALYTFPDVPPLPQLTWPLIAHELTHALQDQHYGFAQYPEMQMTTDEDRQRAFQSLFEGDASIIMPQILKRADLRDLGLVGQLPRPKELGDFVKNQMVFPYSVGGKFVQALYDRGGFALVDKAYQDIPKSTEQILHPEKYYDPAKRDEPTEIKMPSFKGSRWQLLSNNTVGEFGIIELLGVHLGVDGYDRAVSAASGWDGDRFHFYALAGGKLVGGHEPLAILWNTVWDGAADANEFADALEETFRKRFSNLTVKSKTDNSVVLENKQWRAQIIRKDDKVSLIQTTPAQFADFFAEIRKSGAR